MAKVQFQDVELLSGETVRVEPWSWLELMGNLKTIASIVADVTSSAADLTKPEAIEGIVLRQANRLEGLIVASLKNGKDDMAKLRGLEDIVDVLTAVIEVNGVMSAVGKIQGMVGSFKPQQS
jgi:hypothetical protein